jgi:ABC-2 type transport system permease protein
MLTMRSLAEERRFGTIETLLTAPIHPHQVVLAKFLAAYLFYLAVWLLFLVFPVLADKVLAQPDFQQRLFDRGAVLGNYAFIALSGAFFVAIGIFTSSLTRSQLVAGMLSFSILFMLIVGVAAIRLTPFNPAESLLLNDALLAYFQVFDHFEDFSRGMLDSRPVVYYLSCTVAVLGLSVLVVESKR